MSSTNLRPQLANHLRQRLQAFGDGFRHNLALIGPPGSGKTFQLHELIAQRPAHVMMLYCPLYRESARSFLHRFLSAILQTAGPLDSGALAPRGVSVASAPSASHAEPRPAPMTPLSLETLLQQAELSCPKTVAAVKAAEQLMMRRAYAEAFTRALDAIPVLSGERQQSCAVIFDEFLHLEDMGFVHAFHELGKRVMTWPSTLFVLVSSRPYRARVILRERLHLLFGHFELLTLDALEATTVAAWVRQQLRGLRGIASLSSFLARWFGAHPWYLVVFLRRIRELAALSKASAVTEPLFFQAAWEVLGSSEGALHQWCRFRVDELAHVRAGARAMEALLHIAEGVRTATELGKCVGRTGLAAALQVLVEHDLAERNGMCWIVTDSVLRCWLTAVFAQRADARAADAAVRRRFDASLNTLWADWVHTQQLSFTEQVGELFERFCDETVSLDSKIGRLPKFQSIRTSQTTGPGGAWLVAEGVGKRWCAMVQDGAIDERLVSHFDTFCRSLSPKPSRKVVITRGGIDPNVRLVAKAANMWVWDSSDLALLTGLYGGHQQPEH